MIFFIALINILAFVEARVSYDGPCPIVTPVANFDSSASTGVWYDLEINQYADKFKCTTVTVDSIENGLTNILTARESQTNKYFTITFDIHFAGNETEAIWVGSGNTIYVLDTDYINYKIVYYCQNIDSHHSRSIIISARKPYGSDAIYRKAYEVLKAQGLEMDPLFRVDQDDC